jgi:hypothetical protein
LSIQEEFMGTPGIQTQQPRTADTARDEGKQLAHSAADSTKQVASTVKEEASNVAGEVSTQVRSLAGQASDEVRGQVDRQRSRAVQALRTTQDEFSSLAGKGEHSQLTNELTRRAADQAAKVADYLERTQPSEMLERARSFARRRPGAFLFGAALAGAVVGRLVKSVATGGESPSQDRYTPARPTPGSSIPGSPTAGSSTGSSTTYRSTGSEFSDPQPVLPPPPPPPVGGVPPVSTATVQSPVPAEEAISGRQGIGGTGVPRQDTTP